MRTRTGFRLIFAALRNDAQALYAPLEHPQRIAPAPNATKSKPTDERGRKLNPLLPYLHQLDQYANGLLHILPADPFQGRVERMATREYVGTGQAHEGKSRSVCTASNAAAHRRHPGAADGFERILDDLGMPFEYSLHIAVLP